MHLTLSALRLLFLLTIVYCSPTQAGQIIFLNGTTTSGKTSIARELETLLKVQHHDVEILAIDSFMMPKVVWTMVSAYFDPRNLFVSTIDLIQPTDIEAMIKEAREEICAAAKFAYAQGKTVIIDTPMYRREDIAFYQQSLAHYNVLWTLVYCPLETLINRVISRNQGSGAMEQRSLLQALHQFSCLYSTITPMTIDTFLMNELIEVFSNIHTQHTAMQDKLYDIQKSIQNAICPFTIEQITARFKDGNIGPVIQHDCVVNTKDHNPVTCAKIISEKLFV